MGISDWSADVCAADRGGGTLTVIDDDCVEHEYETGDAFVAPVNPHTARNYSSLPVTVRAAFVLPRTSPPTPPMPTIFVSEDADDVLDEYCGLRSEEHTSELQSLMRISYAVFCLQKKKQK